MFTQSRIRVHLLASSLTYLLTDLFVTLVLPSWKYKGDRHQAQAEGADRPQGHHDAGGLARGRAVERPCFATDAPGSLLY